MEHKAVPVGGVEVINEDEGVLQALVSVTGIKDRVNDVIKPGAYAKTLKKRMPKGIWNHKWELPVAKTLAIRELLPGDPMLPEALSDGTPWPSEAGALWVKAQFNMRSQRGRDAFEDVIFFGDDAEYSVGYKVPPGAAEVKDGVRHISEMDLYEWSPVLFGAMPHARTLTSIKEAQEEWIEIKGEIWGTCSDGKGLCCLSCSTKHAHDEIETKDLTAVDEVNQWFVTVDADEGVPSEVGPFGTESQADRWMAIYEFKDWDPDQPRIPKGKPGGGRWLTLKAVVDALESGDEDSAIDLAPDLDPEDVGMVLDVADNVGTSPETREELATYHPQYWMYAEDQAKAQRQAGYEFNRRERFNQAADAIDRGDEEEALRLAAEMREVYRNTPGYNGNKTQSPTTEEHQAEGAALRERAVKAGRSEEFMQEFARIFASALRMDDQYEAESDEAERRAAPNRRRPRPSSRDIVDPEDLLYEASDDDDVETKRTFTAEERRKAAKKGAALPGGGFPINNATDLRNAIQALGRATNPAAAKRHIIKRARALKLIGSLPEAWNVKEDDALNLVAQWDEVETEIKALGDSDFDGFLDAIYTFLDDDGDESKRLDTHPFNPDLHPRDREGKFTERGGGVGVAARAAHALGATARQTEQMTDQITGIIASHDPLAEHFDYESGEDVLKTRAALLKKERKADFAKRLPKARKREQRAAKLQRRKASPTLAKFNNALYGSMRVPTENRAQYLDDVGMGDLNNIRRTIRRDFRNSGASKRRMQKLDDHLAGRSNRYLEPYLGTGHDVPRMIASEIAAWHNDALKSDDPLLARWDEVDLELKEAATDPLDRWAEVDLQLKEATDDEDGMLDGLDDYLDAFFEQLDTIMTGEDPVPDEGYDEDPDAPEPPHANLADDEDMDTSEKAFEAYLEALGIDVDMEEKGRLSHAKHQFRKARIAWREALHPGARAACSPARARTVSSRWTRRAPPSSTTSPVAVRSPRCGQRQRTSRWPSGSPRRVPLRGLPATASATSCQRSARWLRSATSRRRWLRVTVAVGSPTRWVSPLSLLTSPTPSASSAGRRGGEGNGDGSSSIRSVVATRGRGTCSGRSDVGRRAASVEAPHGHGRRSRRVRPGGGSGRRTRRLCRDRLGKARWRRSSGSPTASGRR